MKKEPTLEEIIQMRPAGTELIPLELDKETILLQIIPSQIISDDDAERWNESLKRVLPKNVITVWTARGVYLKVHRPKHYELNFYNSTFDSPKLVQQIKSSLVGEEHVTITFKKCKFNKKE